MFTGLQNNTLSRADLNYKSGTIKNVHYGDILINFGEYIDVSLTNIPFITDESKAEKYSKSFLKDGDIVIADTAEDESVGKCTEICGSSNNFVLAGLHTIPCRPIEKYGSKYLGFYMNSPSYHDQLIPLMQGIKVTSISKTALQDTMLSFPKSIAEQTMIGAFISNIDAIITLHQCKYYHPQSISFHLIISPTLNYITATWEQRKVSELLEERNEQAPESDDYPLMAFIANEGVAPKGDRYDRGALVKDAENKNYKKTELGDFIYSSNNLETGSIGLNNYGNASISPVYSIFKPTGIADPDFIGRRFVRKDFINAMIKWRQGVVYGQWKIHESDFLKIEVAVPSLGEQRKIGAFLSEIDNLITLHQRQCTYNQYRILCR